MLIAQLVSGCDSVDSDGPELEAQPESSFRIDCYQPEDSRQVAFTASGAIEDSGTVEGDPVPASAESRQTWSGVRTFHGREGDFALYVLTYWANEDTGLIEGEFVMVGGTKRYENLGGGGHFEVILDDSGTMAEVFEGVRF
jgi:hypothetical protein